MEAELKRHGPRKVTQRYDLTGRVFGKLTVEREDGRIRGGRAWLCVCSCGSTARVPQGSLLRSMRPTESCGCLVGRTPKHGMSHHPLYRTWSGIITRCCDVNSEHYCNYGARGITICDRWLNSFENFYADMGEKPSPDFQIDRVNNNGPYSPENCRWVIGKINQQNKRTSIRWTIHGVTYGSLADASEALGLSQHLVRKIAVGERVY